MTSRFSTISCLVLLVALSVWVAAQTGRPEALNYDVTYILAHAERMLDGARYGRDVIDVNPPLIFWLKVPLVLAARVVGIPVWWGYNALVLFLIFASTFLCRRFFVAASGGSDAVQAAGWVVAAALALSLVLIPGYDFGQREHLLVTLTLPYFFNLAAIAKGHLPDTKVRIGVAFMAGVGIALKPFFVLPWIAAELACVWLRKDWRAALRVENGVIVSIQLVYVTCIFAFTDYLDVVAIALEIYPSFGSSISTLILGSLMYWGALIFAIVLWLANRLPENEDALRLILGAALFGFLGAAIVQQKFFPYHSQPS